MKRKQKDHNLQAQPDLHDFWHSPF